MRILPVIASLLISLTATAFAAPYYLSPLPSGFGPYDYTNPVGRDKLLGEVEKYHFDENVQLLRNGMNGSVWGDLTYTLRAFPNHHRALELMGRLLRMQSTSMSNDLRVARYGGMPNEVDATPYFERAIEFASDDPIPRVLYGIHLHLVKQYKLALEQYLAAEEMGLESADLQYNLGLVYTELQEYEKALLHAHKAYALGHPLQGLKRRLVRAGAWE